MKARPRQVPPAELVPAWLLLDGAARPEWMDEAVCAQTDPEAFFPEKGGSNVTAKAICQECPVRAACLEHALTRREPDGIWGGLSAQERRRVLSQRRAAAAEAERGAA